MNATTPEPTLDDDVTLVMRAFRAEAEAQGRADPAMQAFLKDFEIGLRNRLGQSEDARRAIRELFLHRKDAAKDLSGKVLDIGKRAADANIDLQRTYETNKGDASKVASLTNIEINRGIQERRGWWHTTLSLVADMCDGFGPLQFIADWCRAKSNTLTPKTIVADMTQMDDLKNRIDVNTNKAVQSALGVLPVALLPTRPEVAQVTNDHASQTQRHIDDIGIGGPLVPNLKDAPPASGTAKAAVAPEAAASATRDSLHAIRDMVMRAEKEAKWAKEKTDAVTRSAVGADVNNDGKLNGSEWTMLGQAKGLTPADVAILKKYSDQGPKTSVAAPEAPSLKPQ